MLPQILHMYNINEKDKKEWRGSLSHFSTWPTWPQSETGTHLATLFVMLNCWVTAWPAWFSFCEELWQIALKHRLCHSAPIESQCIKCVSLRNKIQLDEIRTSLLISSNRKWAYWCEWSGEFAPKITLTCLARSTKLFCICVVCVSVSTLQYACLCAQV